MGVIDPEPDLDLFAFHVIRVIQVDFQFVKLLGFKGEPHVGGVHGELYFLKNILFVSMEIIFFK